MTNGIKFELNDGQMRQALQAALLASMDEGMRQAVIAQAIEHLTTEPKDNYGRMGKSPLQEGFDRAMHQFAVEWSRELIENDPTVKEAFSEVFKEVVVSLVQDKSELARKVVDGLGDVISVRARDY